MDGALHRTGRVSTSTAAAAYHDHNWGFWDGVSWQWGQVQHDGLSFVYGRVRPPPDAADPSRVPGFLAVLGPNGPLAFSTDATIEESSAPGPLSPPENERPSRIVVRASGDGFDAALTLAVEQTTSTQSRRGGIGGGLDFLQLRAVYTVLVHIGERSIAFTAPGSAETFRGARTFDAASR